jgi:hypothetical protein
MPEIRPLARAPDTDEVLRRVGRNAINFQLVEHLLKRLATSHLPNGPTREVRSRIDKAAEVVAESTMGTLAGKVMETVLRPKEEKPTPDVIEEPWLSFRFTIGADAAFVDQHDKEMQALVEARNELVHHFLKRWHAAVDGETGSVFSYLDAQNEKTLLIMERLRGWVTSMEECRKKAAEFMLTEQADSHFELLHLRSSRLVAMLGEIAQRTQRADGWAYFTTAANLIRRDEPGELTELEDRFGLKSLRAVMFAAELFDVIEEEFAPSAKRTIYRISGRYKLNT